MGFQCIYSSLTRGGFCTLVLFIRSCSHHTPSEPLSSSMDDLFTFYAAFLILVIKIPLGAECALCYQKLLLIRNAVYLNKLLGFSHSHFIQSDIYHSPCRLHASSFFVAFQNPHSSISLPLSTHVLHLADISRSKNPPTCAKKWMLCQTANIQENGRPSPELFSSCDSSS